MRKNALTMITVTTVTGVFGAFFRWLQNINAFEPDTGLMVPFARTAVFMAAYLIAMAGLFAVLALVFTKRFACGKTPDAALRPSTFAPSLLCKLCGVLIAAMGVVMMLYAPMQRHPTMERIFAASSIFGGTAVALLPFRTEGSVSGGRGMYLVPVLFSCVWLVCCYKNNAENPVIWAFLVEILAVAATVIAWYELAAYFYDRANPFAAVFFVQGAAFMDIATLADERSAPMTVMFAVHAALMLMFEFLLVKNLAPRRRARHVRSGVE